MEEWRSIPNFPGYSMSKSGDVRKDATGHVRSRSLQELYHLTVDNQTNSVAGSVLHKMTFPELY